MSFDSLNTSKIIQIFLSLHSYVCSNIKNIYDVVAVVYSLFNNAVSQQLGLHSIE